MMKCVALFVVFRTSHVYSVNITEYLRQYGYIIESENAVTSVEEALTNFQEYYHLPVDGTVNTVLLLSEQGATSGKRLT